MSAHGLDSQRLRPVAIHGEVVVVREATEADIATFAEAGGTVPA